MNNLAEKKDSFANIHKEYYSRASREKAGKANAVRRAYIYVDNKPETYQSLCEKTGLGDSAIRYRIAKLRKANIPLTIINLKETK